MTYFNCAFCSQSREFEEIEYLSGSSFNKAIKKEGRKTNELPYFYNIGTLTILPTVLFAEIFDYLQDAKDYRALSLVNKDMKKLGVAGWRRVAISKSYLVDKTRLQSYFPNIRVLIAPQLGLLHGESFVGFHFLSFLDLSLNRTLSDYSFLSPLKTLRKLVLSHTGFKDFMDIAGLNSLKSLIIEGCSELENFNLLSTQHAQLEELDISGTNVKTLLPVAPLRLLQKLNLARCSMLEDFTPLQDIVSLTHLDLNNTDFSDVTLLDNLKALEFLSLFFTQVPQEACNAYQGMRSSIKMLLKRPSDAVSYPPKVLVVPTTQAPSLPPVHRPNTRARGSESACCVIS